MATPWRVLVTRVLPPGPVERLAATPGVEVVVGPPDRTPPPEELRALARGCVAVIPQVVDRIDAAFLDATAPTLRLVANFGVGYDNIDLAACTARGVLASNTPGVLTEATADLTWALLLGAARRVVEADRLVREGRWTGWSPTLLLGADLSGRTLGVVGLGRIGAAVARRARGFGMQVRYHGPRPSPREAEVGAVLEPDLDRLVASADVLTLHAPSNAGTRHLIDARRLALMKPGSLLINTARGPLVDEAALVAALRGGPLGGAGLDVFEHEPRLAPGLVDLPNVVLLPHLGSATLGARRGMGDLAVDNVLDLLAGRPPRTCLNPGAARTPG